jgi:hypothetical protein
MSSKPINQTCSSIQKRVSQKPYERKLPKKVKKLEEDKDLEEMEEEEGTDWEIGEGTPIQNKRTPEDKNRKITSENRGPVYKYNESDMGPFKVHILPDGCDPKNTPSVGDIGLTTVEFSRTLDDAGQCCSACTTWQTVW